ncbi:TPA: exfoliative toxin E [Staphylococcus aureus]|nr:exfoliative toxin E [Staphylococcus aureus]HEB2155818.1 exfoliative toxin E [Staphylococcus aureus]HEB2194117.1 exfoliative toxin E [Staphylococcus aureus]HEB2201595.1 exfoliative toxin E [Staphylococcus aureus]HEB2210753.1 exfoliative toxin E [Staphylococcus aureus]
MSKFFCRKMSIKITIVAMFMLLITSMEANLYAIEYTDEEIQKKRDFFKTRPSDSELFSKIQDTTRSPYSSVGTVFVKGKTIATGILIGKNTVITNKHIARLAENDPNKVIFTPGSTRDEGSLVVKKTFGEFIAEEINEAPYGGGTDLSIIKLKPNQYGKSAGDLVTPAAIPDNVDVQKGDKISLLGYPYNTSTHSLYKSQIEVFNNQTFQYFAYTEPGNSGSGIFNLHGELVGIHSGKGGQYGLPFGILFNRQIGSSYSTDKTVTTLAIDLKNKAKTQEQ